MDLFVARQAILDESLRTFGYELLFRSGFTERYDGTESSEATVQVISNTFLSLGSQSILGGRRGFINFPRSLLIDGSWRLLPRRSVVIEILETVEADDLVIAACREMKNAGYLLALDDFVARPENLPLLDLADFVKVDVRATSPAECRRLVRELKLRRIVAVAEKVENREEFEAARQMGFTLFQGFFFTHPVIVTGRDIPGTRLTYLEILHKLQSPEFDLGDLEKLVRSELSLAHKLLRYVNSPAFDWRAPIKTIGQAMVALGEEQMRRWLLLAILPGLAFDSPNELVASSLTRAAFCERLAAETGAASRQQELFMMGLFSLLDSILNRPLEALLEELRLNPDSRAALLGRSPNSFSSRIYSLVCACEAADWPSIERWSRSLKLSVPAVGQAYTDSLSWADHMLGHITP